MSAKRPIPSFLIFRDKNEHWRWNYLAANGRIVAMSAEAYLRPQGCLKSIRLLQDSSSVPILVRKDRPAAEPLAGQEPLELTQDQIVEGVG